MKPSLQGYSGYVQVCVKYGLRRHILGPFLIPNRAKIRSKVSFSSFLQKQKSFHWILMELFESSPDLLLEVCRIWAPSDHFWGSFWPWIGPQNRSTLSVSSLLQQVFTEFTWNFFFLSHWNYFLKVCRIRAPRGHVWELFLTRIKAK